MNLRSAMYQEKISKLGELLNNPDQNLIDDPEEKYFIESIYSMYKILLENNQYGDIILDKPVKVKRLIKCNRYIPNYILDLENAQRVVLGGLYVVVDAWLIPTKLLKEASTNGDPYKGWIRNPSMYGLPSDLEVNYATRRNINDSMTIALVTDGEWKRDYLTSAWCYEDVLLS